MTRRGVDAPHCFMLMKGASLSRSYRDMMDHAPESTSVYCCVKSYVRDLGLQQAPVLVLREQRLVLLRSPAPQDIVERKELSDKEIRSCLKLAQVCETKFQMPDAAAALRDTVYKREYHRIAFAWCLQPRPYFPSEADEHGQRNVYFPHLPDHTWELVARVAQ